MQNLRLLCKRPPRFCFFCYENVNSIHIQTVQWVLWGQSAIRRGIIWSNQQHSLLCSFVDGEWWSRLMRALTNDGWFRDRGKKRIFRIGKRMGSESNLNLIYLDSLIYIIVYCSFTSFNCLIHSPETQFEIWIHPRIVRMFPVLWIPREPACFTTSPNIGVG